MKSAYFRKSALIGLDIQPGKLRLVQLSSVQSQYHINRLASRELPAGVFRDGVIVDWLGLRHELMAWVSMLNLKSAGVAVSVPSQLVHTDQIQVPSGLTRHELEAAIWETIQADSSDAREALSLDFIELATTESGVATVFFAAIQQAYLKNLIDCVESAGLRAKIIDIDRYASLRAACFALPLQCKPRVSALLHVCDAAARLIIFNADNIVFHQQWRLDEQQLSDAVRQCLTFYNSKHAAAPVNQLLFCGSSPLYYLLHEIKIGELFIQVERIKLANCLPLSVHANDEVYSVADFEYLLACGLALREMPRW